MPDSIADGAGIKPGTCRSRGRSFTAEYVCYQRNGEDNRGIFGAPRHGVDKGRQAPDEEFNNVIAPLPMVTVWDMPHPDAETVI